MGAWLDIPRHIKKDTFAEAPGSLPSPMPLKKEIAFGCVAYSFFRTQSHASASRSSLKNFRSASAGPAEAFGIRIITVSHESS